MGARSAGRRLGVAGPHRVDARQRPRARDRQVVRGALRRVPRSVPSETDSRRVDPSPVLLPLQFFRYGTEARPSADLRGPFMKRIDYSRPIVKKPHARSHTNTCLPMTLINPIKFFSPADITRR